MSLYLVIVLAVPFVVTIASSTQSRVALTMTIAATWLVALFAYNRLVPDRDDLISALSFFLVYVHLVTAPTAGLVATVLVPRTKGFAWPMVAALVGSVAAVVLQYALPFLLDDEQLERSIEVLGPVVFASTAAVMVAGLTAKKVT